MPPTLTYPGVYIEELPSTNHTIAGVATSITAFVGYTKQGPANQPTEVFGFGDFERTFGTLDPDCPLTYAVQQFFLNGGGDAFIVRVAHNAQQAQMDLLNNTTGTGMTVLSLAAVGAGLWGNALWVTVDHDALNPLSLFNLSVTKYAVAGGKLVAARAEAFRNLTMNSQAPTYAVDTINHNSQLLTATRPVGLPSGNTALPAGAVAGTSTSGALTAPLNVAATANAITITVAGGAPTQLTIPAGPYATLAALQAALQAAATAAGANVNVTVSGKQIVFQDKGAATEASSVHITPAPANDATVALLLGVAAGGTEVDAIAGFHPMPTGTSGADIDTSLGATTIASLSGTTTQVKLTVTVGSTGSPAITIPLTDSTTVLSTKEDLRALLQTRVQAASLSNLAIAAQLGGATVRIINNAFVVTAGGRPDAQIALSNASGADKTAKLIGFDSASGVANLAAYSPAVAAPLVGEAASSSGADGTAPTAAELQGDPAHKTGIYALENVDLFNLLVLPDEFTGPDWIANTNTAIAYCEQRRAMLLLDLPSDRKTLADAQTWIKDPSTPKSANAAAYFPRSQFPDPMQSYRSRRMPSAGAIAGLYARTDSARGVWKAPAGTEAQLRGPTAATLYGPTGVQVPLTDMENGTINPLGLNAIRALPVYGIVAWGARTLFGADVMANQWKYVPVRRTALYIEESLYRGTKWVVFEPNDEPLWAQIRLSVGAFMHNLFRQGAFQGSSPRQAYLVKCDRETTTQNDIDLGIVNILVGFAPLKPAEFVVIQITQLAGQVET